MDSTDMTTDKNIKTILQVLINEIIATAVETVREENTAIEEDTAIDSAVAEVVEELLLLVCQSSRRRAGRIASAIDQTVVDDTDTNYQDDVCCQRGRSTLAILIRLTLSLSARRRLTRRQKAEAPEAILPLYFCDHAINLGVFLDRGFFLNRLVG